MYIFLIVIYAILCLALVGLILLQRGRGSQTGLTYDPQASVFGSSGSVSFLVKVTTVLSIIFFALGIFININFRESLVSDEKSLIEQALANEESAEEAEEGVDLPEDVPAAEGEGAMGGDVPDAELGSVDSLDAPAADGDVPVAVEDDGDAPPDEADVPSDPEDSAE